MTARGPVSSRTRPLSIDSCTDATIRATSNWATVWSRNSITSSKLCPVSTCITGNGMRAGQKARWARWSMTTESLPPENSSTGRAHSAATSRMIVIASSSSSAVAWGAVAALGTGSDPTGEVAQESGSSTAAWPARSWLTVTVTTDPASACTTHEASTRSGVPSLLRENRVAARPSS